MIEVDGKTMPWKKGMTMADLIKQFPQYTNFNLVRLNNEIIKLAESELGLNQ